MSPPLPATAPALLLNEGRHELLDQLTAGLDSAALSWLSGYAAGLAAERAPHAAASTAERSDAVARATILYASQTGNGRRIAERLARNLESSGVAVRTLSTADYPVRELAEERLLYLVASTHGDGDPPDDARTFIDHLFSRRAPRLDRLAFSVLALGDSSYPKFCEIGRRFDAQLAALGARRLSPRVDCDVDYEIPANTWLQAAAHGAQGELQAPRLAVVTALRPPSLLATRDAPFETDVLGTQRISGRHSDRLVMHLELAAPPQRLAYEPGDAVGIWHQNPTETVGDLIELLKLSSETAVTHDGHAKELRNWLIHGREITRLTRSFVEAHSQRSGSPVLAALLEPEHATELRMVLKTWQLADLLKAYPAAWSGEELVAALRPLTPRLYSIASSRRAVGDELHLTVAAVDYQHDGEQRYGAASRFLTTLDAAVSLEPNHVQRVRAYIEPNLRFRLPADTQRNVIMIGPGTGVAPFRGFLQERAATGGTGQNWLFLGGRHFGADFLYQAEWLDARKRGTLHRLDVAFSRDQAHKIYVQDRLRERGAELYQWLRDGAHLYVCGDAERMAPDVHAALIDIVARHGALRHEAAAAFVDGLANERRYVRDVY